MKTTYLVNQVQPDGSVCLAEATAKEWYAITHENKNLPAEQQRYFISDYIVEDHTLDRMVIEVSADYYRQWHREHIAAERNRAFENKFQHISADAELFDDEVECVWDVIPTDALVEDTVCNRMLFQELEKRLAEWKPWANDLLRLYLQGERRTCTEILAQKYGVSSQAVRKYKRQFEEFLKKFLEVVSF